MRKIVVLEDQEVRIQWLRAVVPFDDIEIVWCTSVGKFLKEVREPNVKLVIFDHDLDLFFDGPDKDGLTGTHAARGYRGLTDTPVLIWSFNKSGALNIKSILASKGIRALWVPFMDDNKIKLARTVLTLLTMFE